MQGSPEVHGPVEHGVRCHAGSVQRSGSNGPEAGSCAGVAGIETAGPKGSAPAAQQQSGSPDDSWQQVALQERAVLLGSPEPAHAGRAWYRDKQVGALAAAELHIHTAAFPAYDNL